MSITVKRGPLAKRKFNNLMDYLAAQAIIQESCYHFDWKEVTIITGKNTGKPKVVIRKTCKKCGCIFEMTRKPLF